MFYWLFRQFSFLRKALPRRGDSSRQLALGVALGLMVGLIPKGNLTAVAISVVIFASTVNLGTAMITATVTSLANDLVDPLLHRLGFWVLHHEALLPYWTDLSQRPLAPWTSFNNTVVMGGFVAGLVLLYPTYRASRAFFERYWIKAPAADDLPAEDETDASAESREPAETPEATKQVSAYSRTLERPSVEPSGSVRDRPQRAIAETPDAATQVKRIEPPRAVGDASALSTEFPQTSAATKAAA